MSGGKKYTTQHEHAILALLEAPTIDAAAKQAGISPATMTRWLKREDFQAAYRAARRTMFESSLSRLQTLAGKAVSTLEKNLTCGKVSTEVRSAEAILLHGKEAAMLLDVTQRLAELETLLQQKAAP
jgi:hypothetical protein